MIHFNFSIGPQGAHGFSIKLNKQVISMKELFKSLILKISFLLILGI